jgi:mannose-6-phosphate isomerase-like protein (cupin superfamily)
MFKKSFIASILFIFSISVCSFAQDLDGKPYIPGEDANIDMFIGDWHNSMPKHTHGLLIERDILSKGDPINPVTPGAVLEYVNRFTYAFLDADAATTPTTLNGEQEIFYILSGKGTITAGGKTENLVTGSTVLMPAGLEFTMKAASCGPLTMYLVNEPVPQGFRPNKDMIVKDEIAMPVSSTKGHWVHIVKTLFETNDGLGTLERVLTVSFDPMTIGHPHSHDAGVEEVWTAVTGESLAFIGKQIRLQKPGMGYMIPPDSKTPHSNINTGSEQIKMFYFARYTDHEVRK